MSLRSRTADEPAAAELEITGGRLGDVAPCGARRDVNRGSQIFFNTPVRRKFLRATQTEMGHITEAFTRLALAYPHVHFTLRHGGRTVYDLPPTDDWRDADRRLLRRGAGRDLLWVESDDGDVRLCGYVAAPEPQPRPTTRMQYLFLNGRSIRDRALAHALGESYRGLLLSGRYPICFLRIVMPPDEVDVNVHPTKLEVRFHDAGRIYSQLLGTLRTKFLTVDLTTRCSLQLQLPKRLPRMTRRPRNRCAGDLVAWAKGQLPSQQSPGQGGAASSDDDQPEFTGTRRQPLSLVTLDRTAPAHQSPRRPTFAILIATGRDCTTACAGANLRSPRRGPASPPTARGHVHDRPLKRNTSP